MRDIRQQAVGFFHHHHVAQPGAFQAASHPAVFVEADKQQSHQEGFFIIIPDWFQFDHRGPAEQFCHGNGALGIQHHPFAANPQAVESGHQAGLNITGDPLFIPQAVGDLADLVMQVSQGRES